MDIAGTNLHKSTLNNSLGNSPKIDAVIIYAYLKYTNVVAQPCNTETERKYKYKQMRDILMLHIFPAIIPKVSKPSWAERYFKVKRAMDEISKLESNLEYFAMVLQEASMLAYTILYSNNYYMMEDLTDADYEEMVAQGGVTIGH